jgi:putative FmdB family regulatory protein
VPLYDFRCHSCGARFEARTGPDEHHECPECASAETERVPSTFAGPFTVGRRGLAARRSNAARRAREEQRSESRQRREE